MEALSGRHQISVLRWSITARMQFFYGQFFVSACTFVNIVHETQVIIERRMLLKKTASKNRNSLSNLRHKKTKSSTLFFNVKSQNKNERKQKIQQKQNQTMPNIVCWKKGAISKLGYKLNTKTWIK